VNENEADVSFPRRYADHQTSASAADERVVLWRRCRFAYRRAAKDCNGYTNANQRQ
jgi:hypothetical protein